MAGQKGKIPKRRVEGSLEGGSRPQADTWKEKIHWRKQCMKWAVLPSQTLVDTKYLNIYT